MARRERFANDAESTLDGQITAVATSLDVNDASDFPTEGDFRIVIDNEILLVTAVSGNTFTVVRGEESTTAAQHNDGTSVFQILTTGSIGQYVGESYPLFNNSSKRPLRIQDSTGLLDSSDFTWVNQGTATATDNSDGSIFLKDLKAAGTHLRVLAKSAPSTPYSIVAAIIPNWRTDDGDANAGIGFRESSTGEMEVLGLVRKYELMVNDYDSPTVYNSSVLSATDWMFPGFPIWLKITDDGTTNLSYSISTDGVNFLGLTSVGRTAHMASGPDQVLFYMNNESSTWHDAGVTLCAWHEE